MRYLGQHQRKLDADTSLKYRLLINSVVSSALLNWTEDFRGIKLVEFRGVRRYLGGKKEGSSSSSTAIEIEEFFRF